MPEKLERFSCSCTEACVQRTAVRVTYIKDKGLRGKFMTPYSTDSGEQVKVGSAEKRSNQKILREAYTTSSCLRCAGVAISQRRHERR